MAGSNSAKTREQAAPVDKAGVEDYLALSAACVMQGAIDAEGRERRKIADQLHDEVGGLLSLATLA